MDETLLQHVDALLQAKNDQALLEVLLKGDARDAADIIDALANGKRKTFLLLPPEKQAEVVLLLSESSRDSVLPRIDPATMARFLHFLDEDDATDVLQELPQKMQTKVLLLLKPDLRKRIEKLLTFGPETAGGLMDLHFIETKQNAEVSTVLNEVQNYARQFKQVPAVLLRTGKEIAWIPPRSLVTGGKAEASYLSKIVPSVPHTADREDVLDLMGRENSDIVCVTDEKGKILGVIHMNDLLRVAEAEASEDVYRMGAVGVFDTSYLESRFSTIWRKRVGWLSVLFVAELFTFTALSRFESSIASVTALALFVPLCISTGGNSGSQAATLITRAMALGHITPKDWWRVLKRELFMGIALGLALGAVGFFRASLTPQHVLGAADRWTLGVVIAASVGLICLWGTLVGSMLPLVFKKLGFDPGYASSPFVATFVDVTGIVIYFSIANMLILS